MKVFMSALCFDQGKSGIAEYIRRVAEAISKRNSVVVSVLDRDVAAFGAVAENVQLVKVPNWFAHPLINIIWHLFLFPIYVVWFGCDAGILPAANRRLTLWKTRPILGIVHDLSQFHVAKKYDYFRMLYVKTILPFMVSLLDYKVCISQTTKRDVIKFWGLAENEISVFYNGYDRKRYSVSVDERQSDHCNLSTKAVLEKYGIHRPYLVYVARLEHPGKNHVNLIAAFERLFDAHASALDLDLVLVGGDWLGVEAITERIDRAAHKDQIKRIGYVPIEDLPALYKGAALMIMPSFYEGFGIPLIEAMACGTATCSSNTPALMEVAAGASLHFDPNQPEDIAEKISVLLSGTALRNALIKAGLARASHFDWNTLATDLVELLGSKPAFLYKTIY